MKKNQYFDWALVGYDATFDYRIVLSIESVPLQIDSVDDIYFKDLLKYAQQIRFSRKFLSENWMSDQYEHIQDYVSYLFFPKKMRHPEDYVFLMTAIDEAKRIVINSLNDIKECFEHPDFIFLGFENRNITKFLLRNNERLAYFLRAHPDKLEEFMNLRIFRTKNTGKWCYSSSFLQLVKISSDQDLIVRDKTLNVLTVKDMKDWKTQDFMDRFDLERNFSQALLNERHHLSLELLALKKSLQFKFESFNGGLDESSEQFFRAWRLFTVSEKVDAYPFTDPRTDSLIRQLRSKMNDDEKALVLLGYIAENMKYSTLETLEFFLSNEMYNYPLEWALSILETASK